MNLCGHDMSPMSGALPSGREILRGMRRSPGAGHAPLVAHCHLGLGKLYRRIGDQAKAEKHLTTASAIYREMDMRFWLAQAETACAGGDS